VIEHPWLLVAAVVTCAPLVWLTFVRLFPNFRSDIEVDGVSLVVGAVTGWWLATWTFLKLLVLIVACGAYVVAAYKLAVWVLA